MEDAQLKQAALINAELKKLWEADNMRPLTYEECLCKTAWYTAIYTKYYPDQAAPLASLAEILYARMGRSGEFFTGPGSKYVH
jgi:hypothetical protein